MENLFFGFCFLVAFVKLGHRFLSFFKVFYFFVNACGLYWNMNQTLKLMESGSLDLNQKQAFVFTRFNKIFYLLSRMCGNDSLLAYAKVDVQMYFWKNFTQRHPLFYIKGFSFWALDEINGSCRFVIKKQVF